MRGIFVLFGLLLSTPAFAGFSSAYTNFDLKTCKHVTPETSGGDGEGSGDYECKGYGGVTVRFAEGDLRSFVAFGAGGKDHCAFHQTFGGFNSVGNKIEWRLKNGQPVASIFRWSVSYDPNDSSKQKSWLVVTKIEKGNSCHMGYVEGGYPKANEKARWLADTAAEAFVCTAGIATVFANPGTDVEGLASAGACVE